MFCPLWRFIKKNRAGAERNGPKQRGSVSVETVAALFLLLVLGIGIFSLAVSSTSAYSRIYDGQNLQSELRVALSFIQMKIRQNDVMQAVRVEENPVNGGPAIVIRETYDDEVYETWIYQDEGKLREALMLEGEAPANELSFEIADADGFTAELDNNLLNFSVWLAQEDTRLKMESSILLRSER